MPENDVSVVPANQASWDDLQTVFGRGSAAKCQRIKLGDHDWFAMPVEERAHRLRGETDCGHPEADRTSGMVAYLDSEPVGWVAVEPRANYRRLRGSSVPWAGRAEDPNDPDVWAIVCFAIRPGYRGRGLTRPLTTAAVEYARAHGAKAVEGYLESTERRILSVWRLVPGGDDRLLVLGAQGAERAWVRMTEQPSG